MLAQVIKKGSPKYKTLPNEIERKVEFAKEVWESDLKFHFENEEKILFPQFKGRDYEIDLLIKEMFEEHKMIRTLIGRLEDENDYEDTLNKLGLLLEEHIRKEERILFERLEDLFETELNEMVPIESVKDSL
jgi:iron-sulfur cluster repair protein YtfE (RIC family)